MADIAMCLNHHCPSYGRCHRATAQVNHYHQSYQEFKPEKGKDRCDDYIPNQQGKDYDKRRANPETGI